MWENYCNKIIRTYVNNNILDQMASQAYQANMNKKKEKQAEEVWKKIGQN